MDGRNPDYFQDPMKERCRRCGLTLGAHSGGDTVVRAGANQCPDTEGGMDWLPVRFPEGFQPSGNFDRVLEGTPAARCLS